MSAVGASNPTTGDVVSNENFVKRAEGVGFAIVVDA
jgi:hypothetical protein